MLYLLFTFIFIFALVVILIPTISTKPFREGLFITLIVCFFFYLFKDIDKLMSGVAGISFFNALFENYQSILLLISMLLLIISISKVEIPYYQAFGAEFGRHVTMIVSLLAVAAGCLAIAQSTEHIMPNVYDKLNVTKFNDVLNNPMLMLHPILLYISYATIFTLAIKHDEEYIEDFIMGKESFRDALAIIFTLLTLSLLFSIIWSWDLNSDSWTWDPIESILIIISLIVLMVFHNIIFNKQIRLENGLHPSYINYLWIGPLVSFILVRMGLLDSVHAFAMAANMLLLLVILYSIIINKLTNGKAPTRAYDTLIIVSQVIKITILTLLVCCIILSTHAFFPNITGEAADPDKFEALAIIPLLLIIAFVLTNLPTGGKAYKNQIIYTYISIASAISLPLKEPIVIVLTLTIILFFKVRNTTTKYKIIHSLVFTTLCFITIAMIFEETKDIVIFIGQQLNNNNIAAIVVNTVKAIQNNQILNMLTLTHIKDNITPTISNYIAESQILTGISKSRMYLTILGEYDQAIKIIENNNKYFLKIKTAYTPIIPLIISSIILYNTTKKKTLKEEKQTIKHK